MSEDLPEGWISTDLASLLREPLRNGHSAKASIDGKGIRTLTLTAVTYGDFSPKNTKMTVAVPTRVKDLWLRRGDLLIERSNTPELVGTSRLYRGEDGYAIFPDLVIRARVHEAAACADFIELALQAEQTRRYFIDSAQGSAGSMPKIDQGIIERTPIALPPLAEQRRVVAKVDELLAQVNAAKDRLAKVPAILKRFRQTVLAAACSGRLTEEWRAERGVEVESDASTWKTSDVASVCEVIVDCPHSTPKWTEHGELCLRTTNFLVEGLDLGEVRYVSALTFRERTARLAPRPGDVVYSREGGILGIACLIPAEVKACLGQRMMLMRCKAEMRPKFLCHVLNSPAMLERVRELTGGTAAPHLNVGDVKTFAVPLPSLGEQDVILSRVDSMLALADAVGRRLASAASNTNSISQAILAKAFRGELVPTEHELALAEGRNYETAEELLTRARSVAATNLNRTNSHHAHKVRAGSAKPLRASRRA